MSTTTRGVTNEGSLAEILRLLAIEMRGLREDLKEAGLVPSTAKPPQLRVVQDNDEEAEDDG
jgi:hypothetical protein